MGTARGFPYAKSPGRSSFAAAGAVSASAVLFVVSLGILGLPAPGIPAHILHTPFRLPAQHPLRFGGVGIAGGDIPRSAGPDHMGHRHAVGAFKGFYQIQHAVSPAGAQVERLRAGVGHGVIHRLEMTVRQIHHVDVIPHPGAVVGVVIVAMDGELRQLADGHLEI